MTLYDPLVPATLLAGGALGCLLRICFLKFLFPKRMLQSKSFLVVCHHRIAWFGRDLNDHLVLTSKRHALLSCDVARNEVVNSTVSSSFEATNSSWTYPLQSWLTARLQPLHSTTDMTASHPSVNLIARCHLQGVGSIYSWGGCQNSSVNSKTLLFPFLILVCCLFWGCSVVHTSYASFGKATVMLYKSIFMLLFWTATVLWCPHKLLAMLTALEESTMEMSNLAVHVCKLNFKW